jgi:Eph receptor B1
VREDSSLTQRIAVFAVLFIALMVVGIIVFVRFYNCSKNQDDLDKKTNNHIQLPVDYASNEGKFG